VDLIRHAEPPVASREPQSADPIRSPAAASESGSEILGRRIVLVIDSDSFDAGVWQRAALAARAFLAQLGPHDRAGLYVAPAGPVLEPTIDRARVARALGAVVARGPTLTTQFNLRPSEIVDIAAEGVQLRSPASAVRRNRESAFEEGSDTPTVQAVHMRECPDDPQCPGQILLEANSAIHELETRALESVVALRQMSALLASWPARKTVVLLSGGLTVSDRAGGRPNPPDLSRVLGEAIARANAAIYTLHIGAGMQEGYSATRRVVARSGTDDIRELGMQSEWLDRFSEAAGGALFRVDRDSGAGAFQRILNETSVYYLLGVEPAPDDRDGRLRPLRVRVRRDDTTVRSRSWVIIPSK
jgi:VWFA-related protein